MTPVAGVAIVALVTLQLYNDKPDRVLYSIQHFCSELGIAYTGKPDGQVLVEVEVGRQIEL